MANRVLVIHLVQWLGWVFETQERKKERMRLPVEDQHPKNAHIIWTWKVSSSCVPVRIHIYISESANFQHPCTGSHTHQIPPYNHDRAHSLCFLSPSLLPFLVFLLFVFSRRFCISVCPSPLCLTLSYPPLKFSFCLSFPLPRLIPRSPSPIYTMWHRCLSLGVYINVYHMHV